MEVSMIDIARICLGAIYLASTVLDIKARKMIFNLMAQRKIPMPRLFFVGAFLWKTIASFALIFNLYTTLAALLLALYIFIATLIFNNFWSTPKEKRDFTFNLFLTNLGACFGLLALAGAVV